MKTRKTVLFILLAVTLFLSLCACTKKEPEPAAPSYNVAGRTYYNTVDNYGHEDHSKLWLGKDGSFVFNDSNKDGYKDISGKWTLNENVLTLEADDGSKIILEVKDDDTLTLKSSLDGSKSDDSFSTTETKGSTVTPSDSSAGKTDSGSSGSSGADSSTVTPEPEKKDEKIPCTKITSLYHNYWSYEGTKNWDLEIRPVPENTTDTMTFKSNDTSVVTIDDKGRASAVGLGKTTIDVTCGDQKLTIGYEVREKAAPEGSGASTWVCKNPNSVEGLWPKVYFDGKGNFVFTENAYSGLGTYEGTYTIEDGRYYCNVKTINAEHAYLPEVEQIVFKIVDEKTLKLKTGLAMSQNGDLFNLQ